jgi:hypothetical protein
MRFHKQTLFAASGLVVAVTLAASLSVPTSTAGFTLIGGSLSTAQRDFRVFNNFTDTAANNNIVPHVNFPGHTGAVMSIWKACAEWASVPHAGNGLGDGHSSNPVIGNGGGNFDAKFEGTSTIPGNTNQNIHSEIPGSSGGTLAFTETPISDGWRIRYFRNWTWGDGPGSVSGGQVDLQGVATHEYGHALGLGHSGSSGATMLPSITGSGIAQRSITNDDSAGVQAVYGVISGSKPQISGLSGAFEVGTLLTIIGSNFSTTNNQVWFTKLSSDGVPVKVTNVSSTGGGTQIQVTVPSGAVSGDVMVQLNGSGHSSLSNAFPIAIGGIGGPFITSIDPNFGAAGGWEAAQLLGAGFTGTTAVTFGGNNVASFSVVSAGVVDVITPPGVLFSNVDVEIITGQGSHTLVASYIYLFDPLPSIDMVSPSSGALAGGTVVTVSGDSVIGVTDVTFGGVSGTGLAVTSATTLTVTTPAGAAAGSVDVVAVGAGSDTILGGFTYDGTGPGGTFINIGASGAGGVLGEPVHTGSGDLTPGGTGFTLDLTNASPLAQAVMFVAIGDGIPSPFKGGTFYPIPILLELGITTSVTGSFSLPAVMPLSIPPGFKLVTQFWVADAFALHGAAGSNGLQSIVP